MHCDGSSVIHADGQSKWQITLTSENCTIKKHFEGWQVCIDKILYTIAKSADLFYLSALLFYKNADPSKNYKQRRKGCATNSNSPKIR